MVLQVFGEGWDRHERLVHVARHLATFTRPAILADYPPDTCVLTTRVAIDVLAYYGINAKPLPVHGHAYNAAFIARVKAGQEPTAEEGCRVVELMFHLVAHIPTANAVLDLTIDQACRPAVGLEVSPVLSAIPADDTATDFGLTTASGSVVRYQPPLPEHTPDWRHAPDWTKTHKSRRYVADTIRHINSFSEQEAVR